MVTRDFNRRVANRTVLYLSVFPTAFFLFAPFTEAIFLALALGAVYAIRTDRPGFALVPALLVGLTRPQGVLVSIPLGWEALRIIRAGRFEPGTRRNTVLAGATALAPIVGFRELRRAELDGNRRVSVRRRTRTLGVCKRATVGRASARVAMDGRLREQRFRRHPGHDSVAYRPHRDIRRGLRRRPPDAANHLLVVRHAPADLRILLGGPATPLQSGHEFLMVVMFPVFVVLARAWTASLVQHKLAGDIRPGSRAPTNWNSVWTAGGLNGETLSLARSRQGDPMDRCSRHRGGPVHRRR